MEASGAEAKTVPATVDGREVRTIVVASGGFVQIGEVTFKRADLLLAIGLSSGDLDLVRGK